MLQTETVRSNPEFIRVLNDLVQYAKSFQTTENFKNMFEISLQSQPSTREAMDNALLVSLTFNFTKIN